MATLASLDAEHGRGYTLTNRIWTADGRIYDRSVLLVVMHK